MLLVRFAIRRKVTIAMATLAVTLFGLISLTRLKINLLPELSYPTLTVRTELPGGAPAEVENLITRPIEEAVGVIRNVRAVRSVSRPGQSDVVLEFLWGTDMDFSGIEVRERLDLLQLPSDAVRPLLLRFDPSSEPVMRLALIDRSSGPRGATSEERLKQLRRFADDRLKPDLESIEGSAAVKVSGGLEDEVQVFVDQQRLAQLQLDVQQVAARIGAENVNLSGGRLEQAEQRFLVRTVNEFSSLEDMADTVVATTQTRSVRLRDVARVTRGYKDRTAITRLDGRECIELAIYKEGDANTVQLASTIRARLAELDESLPGDTEVLAIYDQSHFIANAVNEVRDAAVWGGLLAVLVLYFFLRDARATLVAGIVIPVTVVGIFVLMYGFDLSLNVMSLGGIALSIGMLIDNSVVILEAIARRREAGASAVEAARDGTSEVAMAVTASTLTTVAVFFPLVFVSGIAGQLFRDQALTVAFAQLLSLLVSLTLVPTLAAWRGGASLARESLSGGGRWLALQRSAAQLPRSALATDLFRAPRHGDLRARLLWAPRWVWQVLRLALYSAARLTRATAGTLAALLALLSHPFVAATQRGYAWAENRYLPLLAWSLAHRARVLGVAGLAFASALALIPQLGTELIPQLSQGEFSVRLRLAAGAPLANTDRMMLAAQRAAADIPALARVYSVSGSGNRLDANPVDSGENSGELAITLRQPVGPQQEQRAIGLLRERLGAIPGAQFEFARPALFTLSTPLEIVLSGYELDRLGAAAANLGSRMAASGLFRDLRSSVEEGNPEIQIDFDQQRAAQLGMSVRDIADRVVASVRGNVATRHRWHDKKIDVLVRSLDTHNSSIDEVRAIVINPGSERPVTLDAVADVRLASGPAEIRRMAQERVAILSASPANGELGEATEALRIMLGSTPLPAGVSASIVGQSEEMQQSFDSLLLALTLAVFLVYIVMASQFESLLHPFVILFTVPMGLIGAVWALFLTRTTINAVALIGLILLAGIVVNNAIVLVDAINQARARGLARIEAIVAAGRVRLRPILITSISTILGLLPMALGVGAGAEIRRPMAVTVIGGMLVATLLTLVVIPVLYALFDRRVDAPRP